MRYLSIKESEFDFSYEDFLLEQLGYEEIENMNLESLRDKYNEELKDFIQRENET